MDNQDLRDMFAVTEKLYRRFAVTAPRFEKIILGPKWLITMNSQQEISLALRAGNEYSQAEYDGLAAPLRGKSVADVVDEFLARNDPRLRSALISLLNLLSKPLNTTELLARRGIRRTPGMRFAHDVSGKKAGVIGFGAYQNIFAGRCKEFHGFDLRSAKEIFGPDFPYGNEGEANGLYWHFGKNALEYKSVLADLDIVIASGSSIANASYQDVLQVCQHAAIKGLYGPSNELCPDYLFDLGFNYLFSATVRDVPGYLKASLSGQPYVEFQYMDLYELEKIKA